MATPNNVDCIVRDAFFPGRSDGVLVEVGAAGPDHLSASAAYRALGWKVIAIEPNPEFCAMHRAQGYEVLEYAASDTEGDDVEFTLVERQEPREHMGGLLTYESFSSLGIRDQFADLYETVKTYYKPRTIPVKVRKLDTILATHEPDLKHIDLLLIDVEGWEFNVIRGLTLDRYRPEVIIMENLFDDSRYLDFMSARGYVLWRRIGHDDVYVRRGRWWTSRISRRLASGFIRRNARRVSSRLAATMKRTALHIPPIRRLHEQRDQLLRVVSTSNSAFSELQARYQASLAQLRAIEARQELAARMAEASENARAILDRPLAFMHVPKASGIAITTGIREVLPTIPYVGFFDLSHFGTFREFNAALSSNTHVDGLPPALGTDFVGGHFAYSTIIRGRPNARLLTVLREPRSRILSLWMYWRSIPDDTLESWGAWSNRVRLAWQPLAGFVDQPEIACQTDNVVVRMLLWPHPLIPDDAFIDEGSDARLMEEAAARLRTFDFTDVIENPRFEERLRTFLARPFAYRRANETPPSPRGLRVSLREELTAETLELLARRSRLDRKLWLAVAGRRLPGADVEQLGEDVFSAGVARYSKLMAA